jgi:hypothetical protein
MNNIFGPYSRKFVLVFFYDLLVYSTLIVEHSDHLRHVLLVQRSNCLFAKMTKCVFATDKVEYLGHIISAHGVATGPAKVVAIQSLVTPKSVTQLRSFLGLIGYYRRFIKKYGIIYDHYMIFLRKTIFIGVLNTQVLSQQ